MKIQISFEFRKKSDLKNTNHFWIQKNQIQKIQISFWFKKIKSERSNQFLVKKIRSKRSYQFLVQKNQI